MSRYVIIASDSFDGNDQAATSDDGVNWTIQTTPNDGTAWSSVAYGNGTFVALAGTNTRDPVQVMYSTDGGVTWTATTFPNTNGELHEDLFFANGKFVAIGGLGGVAQSADGITWSVVTPAAIDLTGGFTGTVWTGNPFANGKWVTTRSDGSGNYIVATSPDLSTWKITTLSAGGAFAGTQSGPRFGSGVFVASDGYQPSQGTQTTLRSPDGGTTWSTASNGAQVTTPYPRSMDFGNNRFIMVGDTLSAVDRYPHPVGSSTDGGVTWTYPTAPDGQWFAVCFDTGLTQFVAVGTGVVGKTPPCIMTSPDGISWTGITTGVPAIDGGLFWAIAVKPIAPPPPPSFSGGRGGVRGGASCCREPFQSTYRAYSLADLPETPKRKPPGRARNSRRRIGPGSWVPAASGTQGVMSVNRLPVTQIVHPVNGAIPFAMPPYRLPVSIHLSGFRGLGDAAQAQLAQQIGAITGQAATGALAALQLAQVIAASSAVIPLVGAGIAAVTAIVSAILNSGCGQACIMTSNWANQAEQLLQRNIQEYFALPSPRSQSAQAVALANFDNIWNYLVKECGQPGFSTAGIDCTQDRAAGACKWKQTTTSPLLQYPGEPQPGACWNWFNGYRDPIASDPAMPDSMSSSAAGTSPVTSGGTAPGTTDWGTVMLYGGIGLLIVGLVGGMN